MKYWHQRGKGHRELLTGGGAIKEGKYWHGKNKDKREILARERRGKSENNVHVGRARCVCVIPLHTILSYSWGNFFCIATVLFGDRFLQAWRYIDSLERQFDASFSIHVLRLLVIAKFSVIFSATCLSWVCVCCRWWFCDFK